MTEANFNESHLKFTDAAFRLTPPIVGLLVNIVFHTCVLEHRSSCSTLIISPTLAEVIKTEEGSVS